jgi:hypothetical protein
MTKCFRRPCCRSRICYQCLCKIKAVAANFACPECEKGTPLKILTKLVVDMRCLLFKPLLKQITDRSNEPDDDDDDDDDENHGVHEDDSRRTSRHRMIQRRKRVRRMKVYAVASEETTEEAAVEVESVVTESNRPAPSAMSPLATHIYREFFKPSPENEPRYPSSFTDADKRNANSAKRLVQHETGAAFENTLPHRNANLIVNDISRLTVQALITSFRDTVSSMQDGKVLKQLQRRDLGRAIVELTRRKYSMEKIKTLLDCEHSNVYYLKHWFNLLQQIPQCIFIRKPWSTILPCLSGAGKIPLFREAFQYYRTKHGHNFGQME